MIRRYEFQRLCPYGPVPDELLRWLEGHAAARSALAPDKSTERPEVLDITTLPPLASLPLGKARDFALHGDASGYGGDRSNAVHGLAFALYALAGCGDAEVLTYLLECEHSFAVAYDGQHNSSGGDERALQYLWSSCAKTRAHRRPMAADVFPVVAAKQAVHEGELQLAEHGVAVAHTFESLMDRARSVLPHRSDVVEQLAWDSVGMSEAQLAGIRAALVDAKTGLTRREIESIFKATMRKARVAARGPGALALEEDKEGKPYPTSKNVQLLLDHYGIDTRYNLMTRELEVSFSEVQWASDNAGNLAITAVSDLCVMHGMAAAVGRVPAMLDWVAAHRTYHPFLTWVSSQPWDGRSRLGQLLDTIHVHPAHRELCALVVRRWLVSVVAAAKGDYGERPPRGVLTFQGRQNIGKTSWLKSLLPSGMVKEGQHLSSGVKDDVMESTKTLVTELGELDTTFKASEVSWLKAFIGRSVDEYRMPYDRRSVRVTRRTVFAATVNDPEFLVDQTGNTRFWVLPVLGFNLDGVQGLEHQQLWAELVALYDRGEAYLLTLQEMEQVEGQNAAHRVVSSVEALLLDTYAWEDSLPQGGYDTPKRWREVLQDLGLSNKLLSPREKSDLKLSLKRLTGQEDTVRRSFRSPTGSQESGRWWFVPSQKASPGNIVPFAPVRRGEE